MRILIADDDPITLRLLQEAVTRLGHQVVTATDGGKALEILEGEDPPRLALLDWIMPVLDGLDVCRMLRGSDEHPLATYLILVTARSRKSDIIAGLKAGANDYITKPFDTDELSLRIDMGIRVSCLERKLRSRTKEVETLAARVATLTALLARCTECDAPVDGTIRCPACVDEAEVAATR